MSLATRQRATLLQDGGWSIVLKGEQHSLAARRRELMQKEVLKQLYPTPPFGERACNKECLVKSGKYIQPYSDCSLRRQDMTCT